MCTSSRRGRSASIVWRITRMGASLVRPTPTPRVNLPEHCSTVSFDTEARSSSDHAEIGATAIPDGSPLDWVQVAQISNGSRVFPTGVQRLVYPWAAASQGAGGQS